MKKVQWISFVAAYLSGILFLLPLLWTLVSAFKPESSIMSYPPEWIPRSITMVNFSEVLHKFAFMRWILNSFVVASLSTIGVIIIDSLAAYALARLHFAGQKILMVVIVSMLLVPTQVDIIPLFLLFSKVHLTDTYMSLIFPTLAHVTGVYLLTQFFRQIPVELEEAAKIDGCGFFRMWIQIILPISKPILSTVAIITFVFSWNNFLWPLIVTNSDAVKTLPVGIAQFMGASSGSNGSAPQYGITLAGALMATAPSIIIFFALQRFFVRGISSAGIKG
ncbi:carbohydrate ABC transporter permease [Fodinisporobacter ferrooxydans]|uniref:Carbohydrate ABC transporter permease n=1 Tax=Fodinisporobacter ferrooxydans TaxID=2901836 RepID=A0ABY4CPP9_9BACL|nr:carbohydrate ABC transporter permease [Alicyclobacillaceae bacterium MYW30-H2]